jgi:hypothetical protein
MKIARVVLFIFLAFSVPVMAVEKETSVEDTKGVTIAELRLLLNSFGALGEGYVAGVFRCLKLISATEEARSGEWGKMRTLLATFGESGIKAAAVWFAKPDGSYYTVEKGLTGLNLSDRPYFPGLMAGGEVTGALVLSKSTGKRTVIVAVPVKRQGKIISFSRRHKQDDR